MFYHLYFFLSTPIYSNMHTTITTLQYLRNFLILFKEIISIISEMVQQNLPPIHFVCLHSLKKSVVIHTLNQDQTWSS